MQRLHFYHRIIFWVKNQDKKNMRSYCIVLAWSLISSVTEARESLLMQTLTCFTDYESYTACTWFERQEARSLVNMTLFHKNNDLNLTNMACSSQKVGSRIRWECHRKQIIFNMGVKNVFIFRPEQSLDVQLNVSFFDNVQPPPPQKLVVNVTADGDSLLIWEASNGANKNYWLDGALDYEVSYKRFWESWQESSSLLVSNASHCLLQRDNLVPGNTYVARVRSKPGQESQFAGCYSHWSSVVTWDTPEGEVEGQPKNLRCRFNSIDKLKCSWEVRQEITNSVLFALFYKDNPASQEKECSPVHEKQLPSSPLKSPHHVLQSCEISVTNLNRQSQYLVIVRPKEEKREVEATKQIKTAPPYNLSVKVLNDQVYSLQWEVKVPLNIQQMSQISYWKTGNPLEAKSVSAGIGHKQFTFTSEFLEPGSSYTAKVQAKVHGSDRDGPWSEWSKEIQWTTNNIFPLWGILLIGVISIILIMVGLFSFYKCLLSKKRKWDATIPSPPRTLLLPDFFQKAKLSDGSEDSSSQSFLEFQGSGCTNILERNMLVTHPESLPAESRKTEQHLVASQTMEQIKLSAPKIDKADQFFTQSVVEKTVVNSHQTQIFDYDGPYLHLPPESSPLDVSQDGRDPPSEKMENSLCLKHMGLSHCLCPQQLLVGKEKEAVPLFLSISEVQKEEKQQLPKRQERSQSDKSEKEENKVGIQQHLSGTNSPGQSGPLDYVATENLSISKEEGALLWVPMVASEKGVPTCVGMTTGEATANLSSSNMEQKIPDIVLSAQEQTPAVPSVLSQDDYVMSLPATPGSVLKEGLVFSIEEPKDNRGFLIFNPDNKSPVFLRQVGEYCFFPSFKLGKEFSKNPVGTVECDFSQTGCKVTKPLNDSKPVGSKLQSTLTSSKT